MKKEEALKRLYKVIEEHPPDPNCQTCKGRGFVSFRPIKGSRLIWAALGRKPCICCFVSNEETRTVAMECLKSD